MMVIFICQSRAIPSVNSTSQRRYPARTEASYTCLHGWSATKEATSIQSTPHRVPILMISASGDEAMGLGGESRQFLDSDQSFRTPSV